MAHGELLGTQIVEAVIELAAVSREVRLSTGVKLYEMKRAGTTRRKDECEKRQ